MCDPRLEGSTDSSLQESDNSATANGDEYTIPRLALLRVLEGVGEAMKVPDDRLAPVHESISKRRADVRCCDEADAGLSVPKWLAAIAFDISDEDSRQLASLALGISLIRQRCRQDQEVTASDLELAWRLIHGALTSILLTRPLGTASRSAQGFLAVALHSLVEDGCIDELFRLHVWMSDGQRGNPEVAIHSHQPFAQSWVLAGKGKDHSYTVEPTTDLTAATRAEYALALNDGKTVSTTYTPHQTKSVIENTHKLVRATPTGSAIHTRDMSYTIPAATFYRTDIPPNSFHATIFFFDSRRGFVKDAGVLGAKDADSSEHVRDPAGVTPELLANVTNAVRSWEIYLTQGRQHSQRAEWEHALRAFNSALHLCEQANFPNPMECKHLVQGELGNTYRRLGRYEQAKDLLEAVIAEKGLSIQRIELSGELGVIYRHMNRLEDAKRVFEDQYDMATELGFDRGSCRAVGNLGMINYQLSQQNHDEGLLHLAIRQLNERVQSSRRIRERVNTETSDRDTKAHWTKVATNWETIGLNRLSLCHTARGAMDDAIAAARQALNITISGSSSDDPTVVGFSRLLYGRALLLDGQYAKALEQFNPTGKVCTPAMVLCKEPSEEHRQYLRELVDAGADMDLVDEQGYTALDYAVFNDDQKTVELVLEGLCRKLEDDVESQLVDRLLES